MNKKKILTALILFIGLFFSSNALSQDVNELLKDPDKQNEVFKAIVSDHSMFMKLMETAKKNEHSKMMMMESMMDISGNDSNMMNDMSVKIMDNPDMMKMMMNNMMKKTGNDSMVCKDMCKMMMKDETMKCMMKDMMKMDDNHNIKKEDDDRKKDDKNHNKHH